MALSENIETLYLFFPCCHAIQYITLGAPGGCRRRYRLMGTSFSLDVEPPEEQHQYRATLVLRA